MAAAGTGKSASRARGVSIVVVRADTDTLIYYACVSFSQLSTGFDAPLAVQSCSVVYVQSQCHKTLNKKLRPGPGGRLAATEKYATCTHCHKEVLPRPTFMLPLIVAGVFERDGLQPRKLIALDEIAAQLFGCTAEEFSNISARQPSMASLIETLLEGRRFWVRTKENRKRQHAAAIITELLPLDSAPPLVASASALLRARGLPAPASAANWVRHDDISTSAWLPATGGPCLVYKFHVPKRPGVAATRPAPACTAVGSNEPLSTSCTALTAPSTPHVAGPIRRSRVFDPVDGPANQLPFKRARLAESASQATVPDQVAAGQMPAVSDSELVR